MGSLFVKVRSSWYSMGKFGNEEEYHLLEYNAV
jgi:hypothetical protein